MQQPHPIAERKSAAVATRGTRREYQTGSNVIYMELSVNTDFFSPSRIFHPLYFRG
jgi:hypothetical protein